MDRKFWLALFTPASLCGVNLCGVNMGARWRCLTQRTHSFAQTRQSLLGSLEPRLSIQVLADPKGG